MRIDRLTIAGWIVALTVLTVLFARPHRGAARIAPDPIPATQTRIPATSPSEESPNLFRIDGPLRDVASESAPVSERYALPVEPSEVRPVADFAIPQRESRSNPTMSSPPGPSTNSGPLALTPPSAQAAIPPGAYQNKNGNSVTNQFVAKPNLPAGRPDGSTAVGPVREGDTETTIVSRPKIELRGDGAGMQAVDAQAMKHVVRGFSLGDRAALYSARTEFLRALRMITQAIDAQTGLPAEQYATATSALSGGLQALKEADDFNPTGGELEGDLDLKSIIGGHRTPVCKESIPATGLEATQRYFDFARTEIARSVARNRTASQALAGLGKSYSILLDDESNPEPSAGPKAMVFHLAALQCDPRNHLAANELGVLYGRYGQWVQAKQSFLQSLAAKNDPATWDNLAQVHARLGERELANLALQERNMNAPRDYPNRYSAIDGSPSVRWVDPRAFGGPPDDGIVAQRGPQYAYPNATRSGATR